MQFKIDENLHVGNLWIVQETGVRIREGRA